MTADQFIYWLSGYITGLKFCDNPEEYMNVLESTLKTVKLPMILTAHGSIVGGCIST